MAFRLKIIQVGKFPTSWNLTKLQDFGTHAYLSIRGSTLPFALTKTHGPIFVDLREKRNPFICFSLSLMFVLFFFFYLLSSSFLFFYFFLLSFLSTEFDPVLSFFFPYFLILSFPLFPPRGTCLNVSHSHKCTTCHAMCHSPKVPCDIHKIMPCVTRHLMPRKT